MRIGYCELVIIVLFIIGGWKSTILNLVFEFIGWPFVTIDLPRISLIVMVLEFYFGLSTI